MFSVALLPVGEYVLCLFLYQKMNSHDLWRGKLTCFFFLVVELFHPLSIPFPWHARVNLYVKHSARNHRDDLTVVWNEKDQVQQHRAN